MCRHYMPERYVCKVCAGAPLAGGYFDSRDVVTVLLEPLCRSEGCQQPAEFPPSNPRYCSLDCVIDNFDPDVEGRLKSEYIQREIAEESEALIESAENPLLELMRDRDGWRGMSLVEAERKLRHLLHWYFEYTKHKDWPEP